MIAKVREAIEKLREYRTALISAAVTGKIDVREEVALMDISEKNFEATIEQVLLACPRKGAATVETSSSGRLPQRSLRLQPVPVPRHRMLCWTSSTPRSRRSGRSSSSSTGRT